MGTLDREGINQICFKLHFLNTRMRKRKLNKVTENMDDEEFGEFSQDYGSLRKSQLLHNQRADEMVELSDNSVDDSADLSMSRSHDFNEAAIRQAQAASLAICSDIHYFFVQRFFQRVTDRSRQ